MFRIEAVCAGVLFLGASAYVSAEDDGPAPVNTTQSISAGADIGLTEPSASGNGAGYGHASGVYTGVVPRASELASGAEAKAQPHKGPLTITWPGFQMLPDGSSRVFIQSTAPLAPKVLPAADGKFELQLPGARVTAHTNRLPLDTRFFNTPVSRVSLSVARSGATLQLEMRAPVTPQISTTQGNEGYYFTFVELPKGEYIKDAAPANAELPTMQTPKPGSKIIGKPATSAEASGRVQNTSAHGEVRATAGFQFGR